MKVTFTQRKKGIWIHLRENLYDDIVRIAEQQAATFMDNPKVAEIVILPRHGGALVLLTEGEIWRNAVTHIKV